MLYKATSFDPAMGSSGVNQEIGEMYITDLRALRDPIWFT
jgi:hypothetical protein